jgi:hypothetical protein
LGLVAPKFGVQVIARLGRANTTREEIMKRFLVYSFRSSVIALLVAAGWQDLGAPLQLGSQRSSSIITG